MPDKFSEELLGHTKNGYRVLACATKSIPDLDNYESAENRIIFENDLIFLGFVVFKNKLKRDTKHVISKLMDSNINLIMATGDNPFTSISVAKECGLVESHKEIYFCNLEKDLEGEEKLKWYNINIRKENLMLKANINNGQKSSLIIKGKFFFKKFRI